MEVSHLLHNFLNWHEEEPAVNMRTAAKLSIAKHFHRLLAEVVEFFRDRQRSYHFYASSLLFVYDYDVIGRIEEQQQPTVIGCELADHVRLKLIDFAHVFPAAAGSPDDNFLFGVENLLNIFQNFLDENGENLGS